jgi:hypothetical protein
VARRDPTMFLLVIAIIILVIEAIVLFTEDHVVHGVIVGICAILDVVVFVRILSSPPRL